jgi:hypothetical protein
MSIAALTNRTAQYVVIRSIGSRHTGFFIRNRRYNIKRGYEIVGYANNTKELNAILFPK